MKKYNSPIIEMVEMEVEDVIALSIGLNLGEDDSEIGGGEVGGDSGIFSIFG